MNVLDITGMKQRIENGYYKNTKPYPVKTNEMKDGYITDEDKSVRWNREQVELAKQKYRQQQDEYQKEENRVENLFRQDVIDYIMNFYGYKEEAAKFLFNKAYDDGHAYGYPSILDVLDNLLDIVSDFIEYNK